MTDEVKETITEREKERQMERNKKSEGRDLDALSHTLKL